MIQVAYIAAAVCFILSLKGLVRSVDRQAGESLRRRRDDPWPWGPPSRSRA